MKRFRRYGKAYHLEIEGAEDLRELFDLDEVHWAATSAPVHALNLDPVLAGHLDWERDGWLQSAELTREIRWLLDVSHETDGIDQSRTEVAPRSIQPGHPDGQRILSVIKRIQRMDGMQESEPVSLARAREIRTEWREAAVSADGVVLPAAAEEPALADFFSEVIRVTGGSPHPSGERGVTPALLEQFLAQTDAYWGWLREARPAQGEPDCEVLPFGKETTELYEPFKALRDKLDEFFALCDLVALDYRLKERFGPGSEAESPTGAASLEQMGDFLARQPLAEPNPEGFLDLEGRLNPYYVESLHRFREQLLERLYEVKEEPGLTQSEWRALKEQFAAYEQWLARCPEPALDALSEDCLEEFRESNRRLEAKRLMEQSLEARRALDDLRLLEKFALYQGNLLRVANNLVSFPDLYAIDQRALFEEGTLIMDGRRFHLAVRVTDRAEHLRIAGQGWLFILYVEIADPRLDRRYEVAVPVTSGTRGHLYPGKRGVFWQTDGGQCAARIHDILERPVSFQEAFRAPFERFGAALTSRLERLTGSAETRLQEAGSSAYKTVHSRSSSFGNGERGRPEGVGSTQAQPSGPQAAWGLGGLVAGGGIAIAALASSLAFLTRTLAALEENWWTLLAVLGGAVLAVVLPTLFLAFLRLRKRDLSVLLEGAGWAVNAPMRLTRAQRRWFTQRPRRPRR